MIDGYTEMLLIVAVNDYYLRLEILLKKIDHTLPSEFGCGFIKSRR